MVHSEEHNHCFTNCLASRHCRGHFWPPPSQRYEARAHPPPEEEEEEHEAPRTPRDVERMFEAYRAEAADNVSALFDRFNGDELPHAEVRSETLRCDPKRAFDRYLLYAV